MEHHYQRLVVETARYRITGVLRLPREGYRSRLTDYLNSPERSYLPLTDVEIVTLDEPSRREQVPFIALSMRHVVLAIPVDDEQGAESREPPG